MAAEISIICIRSQQRLGLKLKLFFHFRKKAKCCFRENRPDISVFAKIFILLFTAEKINVDVTFYKILRKLNVLQFFPQFPFFNFILVAILVFCLSYKRKVNIFLFS
jgi:hypothetical protein